MKNITIKLICSLFAILLVLSAVSCGNTGNGDTTTTAAAETSDVPAESGNGDETGSEDTQYTAVLPGMLNKVFTIASGYVTDTKYTSTLISVEEPDGNTIGEAVYRRAVTMQDKHGVTLDVQDVNYKTINNSTSTGNHEWDIGTATLSEIMNVVNTGKAMDLYNVENIDLDMPWWDQNAQNKFCIGPKLYYTLSDFFITGIDNARCFYFNKDMAGNLGLGNLYDLVDKNEWTIDKMKELAHIAVADTDGLPGITIDDTAGIVNNATTFYEVMLTGCNAEIVFQGKNGIPYFPCFNDSTAFVDVYTHLLDNFSKDDNLLIANTDNSRAMFMNGNALFTTDTMYYCAKMRAESEINFGIMPIPKYSSDQENYLHVSPNPDVFFVIEGDAETTATTGSILEALSYYSSQYYASNALMPTYFQLCLTARNAPDVDSSNNLQIVHDNISYVIKIIGTDFSSALYKKFAAADYNITGFLTANKPQNENKLKATLKSLLGDDYDKYVD